MARHRWVWLVVLVAVGGCNAPPVQREEETERFRAAMQERMQRLEAELAQPLTSDHCVALALENSLDLRVRELALRLRDDQVRIELSGALPKASLRFDDLRRSNEAAVEFSGFQARFEDRHQQHLAIQATVPVLDFGATWYAYQNALDHRRQDRLLLARARQLLERDVRIAYAQHAGAIRQAELARVAHLASLQVLRVARSLEREKLTVPADTALIEAAVAQAALELSLSQQGARQTHLQLAQLMSLPPGVEFAIFPDLPALPAAPTADELAAYEQNALATRPELAAQDLQRHIAANEIRREAAAFFPRIDALGSFIWSSQSVAVNPAYFLYGFSVAHSLLDGGATIWRHNQAKKAADVEAARTLLISLGVIYEVEMRTLRVWQAGETIEAARTLERARKAALTRIISLYEQGLEDEAATARSLADLTAQATVLDRALTDYQVAWHELEAAALPAESAVARAATQPTTRPAEDPNTPAPWERWMKAIQP